MLGIFSNKPERTFNIESFESLFAESYIEYINDIQDIIIFLSKKENLDFLESFIDKIQPTLRKADFLDMLLLIM